MTQQHAPASRRRGDADVEQVLFDEEAIASRVAELGRQVSRDYRDVVGVPPCRGASPLLMVGILRGAAIFMGDLARAVDLPVEMDYMTASSYGDAAKTSGTVSVAGDAASRAAGRHVLIVEDIVDTGLTLARLMEEFESCGAASVASAALLRKRGTQQVAVQCAYVGFECPEEFVVGYGLDYAQRYRNLPYIGILKPDVYRGR